MRKINLLQQSTASDPRLQELFTELSDTRFALAQAYVRFDNTTEPELRSEEHTSELQSR